MTDEKTNLKVVKPARFDLVLEPKASAELGRIERDIKGCTQKMRRGAAQLFTYAYIAGKRIQRATELLPHGKLQQWINARFPDATYRTAHNWSQFATDVQPKLEEWCNTHGGKSETVSLLNAPNPKLDKRVESAFLEVIPQLMDGKSMGAFMRDAKLLREPKRPEYHAPTMTEEEKVKAEMEQNTALANMAREAMENLCKVEVFRWELLAPADYTLLEDARIRLGEAMKENKRRKQ